MLIRLKLSPDSWRSRSATDGLKNGDASSSSLAAKGFRSVRPNLQDKKSPTQVKCLMRYNTCWCFFSCFVILDSLFQRYNLMICIKPFHWWFLCQCCLNLLWLLLSNWQTRRPITCHCRPLEGTVSSSHPLALTHQTTAPWSPWLMTLPLEC